MTATASFEATVDRSILSRTAQRCCSWSERWFPDAFAFATVAVAIVSLGAFCSGALPLSIEESFGSGFWSVIPFTMQMAFIIIGGYVIADSPPVFALVTRLAAIPRTGRGAVALVALLSAMMSLIHWGFSMVFSALLVRAMARRTDLPVDYRAAGAAPNLINPFWMLPILGILGLKARDLIGFTVVAVRDQSPAGAAALVGPRRNASLSSAACRALIGASARGNS